MTGREPIDPADIRKGDLIRWERPSMTQRTGEYGAYAMAVDYVAGRDGASWNASRYGDHYLLDRRKPPVELPTEPTLGWASWTSSPLTFFLSRPGDRELGIWEVVSADNEPERWGFKPLPNGGMGFASAERITSFTPATAVPTEALDELRAVMDSYPGTTTATGNATRAFLAAVDNAAPSSEAGGSRG